MAKKNFLQLPSADPLSVDDVIAAVQGSSPGDTVKMTLGEVLQLGLTTNTLYYAGNPNGNVAGTFLQLCWDTTNLNLYICSTSGTTSGAVWTAVSVVLLPATKGGTGVASPTAKTIPVAQGSSAFTFLGPLTNGQLLIGSTGANPVPAGITAGSNISVTNGAGTLTIAASGSASFAWNEVTGTTQAIVVNSGYIPNNAGLVTLTLPATAALGSRIAIQGYGAGGWIIAQNASQTIVSAGGSTTVGVGGSLASTNRYDSVELVCVVANTTFAIYTAPGGILTYV